MKYIQIPYQPFYVIVNTIHKTVAVFIRFLNSALHCMIEHEDPTFSSRAHLHTGNTSPSQQIQSKETLSVWNEMHLDVVIFIFLFLPFFNPPS